MTFMVRISGVKSTNVALERLASTSPARARAAVNRTVGVARARVIKALARITGLSRAVLGGRKGRKGVKGRGYIKLVRATRMRSQGALVGLVEGVRFSNIRRQRLGRSQRKPGGLGEPFRATLRSSHSSLFERKSPQKKASPDRRPRATQKKRATSGIRRYNLPIREVVIPLEPHASRAIIIIMRRVARTVYPAKIWEELRKSITPVR